MSNFDDEKRNVRCSFCGKVQDQVRRIIAGPGVYICNECIELCREIVAEDFEQEDFAEMDYDLGEIPKPSDIFAFLNDYVIGQEKAKKSMAVAVYNHYKRLASDVEQDDVELSKSNIIMLGPTGCGKTLLASTLAKMLKVPFAMADATSLTEAGYVGEDVENILLKLIQAADYDIASAQRGIIYIDEIDKITRKSDNPSITRDVSGEGVQQALLKIIEGTVASVPPQGGRKHPHQELIQIDTTNILFICGGAFNGLESIIEKRIGKKMLGFGADIQTKEEKDLGELYSKVLPEDLLKYGLIPEFVGRVPIIATLENLTEKALIRILTEPKNSLVKQYAKLLEMDGIQLEFEPEALSSIASLAIERKTGARGLRAIIENTLNDIMFDLPSRDDVQKCVVTKDTVLNGNPVLVLCENKEEKAKLIESKENAS